MKKITLPDVFALAAAGCLLLPLAAQAQTIKPIADCPGTLYVYSHDRAMQQFWATHDCSCNGRQNGLPDCTPRAQPQQQSQSKQKVVTAPQVHHKTNPTKTAALQGIKQGLDNAMNSGGQSYQQQNQQRLDQARAQEEMALAAQQQNHEMLTNTARTGQERRDRKIAELSAQLAGPPKADGDMSGLVAGLPAGKQPLDTDLERLKTAGGSGWDTKGKLLGEKPKEPPKPTLFDPAKTEAKDIPKERRTPEVNKWLDERENLRKERAKLEQELASMDQQDSVGKVKKQIEIDKVHNKENYCTFELTEELGKQQTVASAPGSGQ